MSDAVLGPALVDFTGLALRLARSRLEGLTDDEFFRGAAPRRRGGPAPRLVPQPSRLVRRLMPRRLTKVGNGDSGRRDAARRGVAR